METCFKCERSGQEVKLLDAVSGNELVKVCEECSLIENIPIIRKPSISQLKESEKPYTVKERLRRMAGLQEEKQKIKEITKKITDVTLDDLREKQKIKTEEKYKPIELIDNYNWYVLMARKKKKLTTKQLAELIGESETAIKMIENKNLPEDSLLLIKKLEQFFGIKLREGVEREEEAPKTKEQAIEQKKEEEIEEPSHTLKIDRESIKDLTIANLRKIKKASKRIEAEDLIGEVEKEKQEAEKTLLGDDIEVID